MSHKQSRQHVKDGIPDPWFIELWDEEGWDYLDDDKGNPQIDTSKFDCDQRDCHVLNNGSKEDPPWICVALCDGKPPLPDLDPTIKLKGLALDFDRTNNWDGAKVTVYFRREKKGKDEEKGKEWKWKWQWWYNPSDNPSASGQEETPVRGPEEFRDAFAHIFQPRISRGPGGLP